MGVGGCVCVCILCLCVCASFVLCVCASLCVCILCVHPLCVCVYILCVCTSFVCVLIVIVHVLRWRLSGMYMDIAGIIDKWALVSFPNLYCGLGMRPATRHNDLEVYVSYCRFWTGVVSLPSQPTSCTTMRPGSSSRHLTVYLTRKKQVSGTHRYLIQQVQSLVEVVHIHMTPCHLILIMGLLQFSFEVLLQVQWDHLIRLLSIRILRTNLSHFNK